MTDPYWRARIDRPGEPSIPILARRMHRVFWVPPRYRSLLAVALDGRALTLRRLAARIGYSLSGLRHALDSLRAMGLVGIDSARGRHGYTLIRVSSDATTAINVPPTTGGTSRYLVIYGREDDVLWGAHLHAGLAP